jgi:adenosylcobyric acid synthase
MIHDPYGVEGTAGTAQGFGWLDMKTTLEAEKQLKQVVGTLIFSHALGFTDAQVTGYEIHMGVSQGAALGKPALLIDGKPEGAISQDNQIAGTYVHGLFDHPDACAAWLAWAGFTEAAAFDYEALKEAELNRLADCVEQHLDWNKLALMI